MKFHEYFNLLVVIVALANVSAADKGDGDLLKMLAKERKEMSNIFQQENAELRRDDQKFGERDEKLHDRIDKLTEQVANLHGKNDKQTEKVTKLQHQNEKLKKEMTNLHKKLQRQSDPEINDLQQGQNHDRQKDQQNQTSEFDQRIKQSIRQEDVHSELKKIIKTEINDFLINEKICVSGAISGSDYTSVSVTTTHLVRFGYTFPRKPTVSVAISFLQGAHTSYYYPVLKPIVTQVRDFSAVITVRQKDVVWSVSWIACL